MEEEKKNGKEIIQEETETSDETDTSSEIEFEAYVWNAPSQNSESYGDFWQEAYERLEDEGQQQEGSQEDDLSECSE